MRKKEAEVFGAMWDSLPVTEKERDEICFQNLNAEVELELFWQISLAFSPEL